MPLASPSPFPGPCELIGFRLRFLRAAAERGWVSPTPQAASAHTDLWVQLSQEPAEPREGSVVHLEPSQLCISGGFQSQALGNGFVFLAVGIFWNKQILKIKMLPMLAEFQRP